MSKKIWRGHQYGDGIDGKQISESTMWGEKFNATVVPDAACFPVREAMAVCKAIELWYNSSTAVHVMVNENKLAKVANKYLAAVERMKKKAGKK